MGHVTRTAFDALDRVKSETDSGNNTTSFAYDQTGNLIRINDPLGRVTQYRYDVRNRPTATIDPAGNFTTFRYDLDGHTTALTDARGNLTSFEYDARGRVTRQVDPLGKARTFTYDAANNLRTKTDRLGRVTEYTYDELNRSIRQVWHNADRSLANTVDFTFDKANELLKAQDGFSSVIYTWDALMRATQMDTSGPAGIPTATLGYTFDPAGNVLSVADTINGQAGGTNTYNYDPLDRMTRIAQTGSGVAAKRVDLQYNALGQMTSLARYADTAGQAAVANSTMTYDVINRPSSITHRSAANAVLDSFSYQYDAASRITQITDIDGATSFTYDTRDELTSATHADPVNPHETYAYDATGNRTSSHLHGQGYKIGDGNPATSDANRLTSDGTYNYAYDDEGNLVRRVTITGGAVRELAYDQRNRLLQVTDRPSANGAATQVVKYTYDVFNRRIASDVDKTPGDAIDGVTTYFIYNGQDVVVELRDMDGTGPAPAATSMRYLHGPEVDQVFAQEDFAGNVLWDLVDHLGSVRDLVNNAGQVVNHLKYDSYGNVLSQSNAAVATRYGFTGREFDIETGLMYFRARYYDPATGRFVSEDPAAFAGGNTNLYGYVSGSPANYVDPSGNFAQIPIALGSAAVGYVGGFYGNLAAQAVQLYRAGTSVDNILGSLDLHAAYVSGGF